MRLSAFWKALFIILVSWAVLQWAIPPLVPISLIATYMSIIISGVILYYSSDDALLEEMLEPVIKVLRDDDQRLVRWCFLIFFSAVSGYFTFSFVKPSITVPPEIRQVHPSPPSRMDLQGKKYDLSALENPIRQKVLAQLDKDPKAAWQYYHEEVNKGRDLYFQNCFYCHGNGLDGNGHYAPAFDPLPTNFQGSGSIAQLQESYLFWRINGGYIGLPKVAMPWRSVMPAWHEMIEPQEAWQMITFLYDYVGQVPRIWDHAQSKQVTGMKDKLKSQRKDMSGEAQYQFRCAVCHGENGEGDGPAAEFLSPRPRDFAQGMYKYKTSPGTLPPRDEDLFNAIKYGLQATSMTGWAGILSDKQITSLIPVLKKFDTSAAWAPEDAEDDAFDDDGHYLKADVQVIKEQISFSEQEPYTPESIEKGKKVYDENCKKCHGLHARGDRHSGEITDDDWGYRIWARDLTKPWSWRLGTMFPANGEGKQQEQIIRNIYTAVSMGIPGSPMPSHEGFDGDEDPVLRSDRWHVANYIYSLSLEQVEPGSEQVIVATELMEELPGTVDDPVWQTAPAANYYLAPNIIHEDRLFTPLNDTIAVRAVYNATEIAFLVEVNDRTKSIPGGEVLSQLEDKDEVFYSDAVAIEFPKENAFSQDPVEKPLISHGDESHKSTIWYWNAGSVEPVVKAMSLIFDSAGKETPLKMRDQHDLKVTAKWADGRWQVLMKRARFPEGSPDLSFGQGRMIPISFANWDGNNAEKGPKHTFTPWFWLYLAEETDYSKLIAAPLGAVFGTFLAGLLLIYWQRKQVGK